MNQPTHNLCFVCDRPTHDNGETPLCVSCNTDFEAFIDENPELSDEETADWLEGIAEDLTVLE